MKTFETIETSVIQSSVWMHQFLENLQTLMQKGEIIEKSMQNAEGLLLVTSTHIRALEEKARLWDEYQHSLTKPRKMPQPNLTQEEIENVPF